MKVPNRIIELINIFYNMHVDMAEGSDEERRALTKLIAEQTRYELGPKYGMKKASQTRPPGKDSIAFLDNVLWAYDWQNGSTRKPHNPPGEFHEMGKSQVFIPVLPVNHLENEPPPVNPPVNNTQPYPDENTWWAQFEDEVGALYFQAGKPFPDSAAAFRWHSRTGYDIGAGMPKEESKQKHLAELKKELGL